MVKSPVQKKIRNSFILGMIITLLITGIIIAFISIKFIDFRKEVKAKEKALKEVFILASDVKAGEDITTTNLTTVKVDAKAKPKNAISIDDITDKTVAKINLEKGTVLQEEMLVSKDEAITDNMRLQEYNMILLPAQLNTKEYVDIRLRLPSGLDYIVLSKKRIEVPQIDGADLEGTIWMKLTEDEIKLMSSAIVEAYIMDGSLLYTSKYIEPGIQKSAIETYVPSSKVQSVINKDPNVTQKAKEALSIKYNAMQSTRNEDIQSILNKYTEEDQQEKANAGTQKEASKIKEERQKYIKSLYGTATE